MSSPPPSPFSPDSDGVPPPTSAGASVRQRPSAGAPSDAPPSSGPTSFRARRIRTSITSSSGPPQVSSSRRPVPQIFHLLLVRIASALAAFLRCLFRDLLPSPDPYGGLSPESCDRCAYRFSEDMKKMYCNGKGNEEEEGIDDAENLPWSTVGYQRLLSCLSDGTYNRAIDDGSEAPSTISQLEEDDGGSVPPPRLVLVYLHSPIHRHTRPFVRDVLLNPRLSSFAAEQSLILWGGDVSRSAEANALAHSLGISTFPALAIVGCPVVQDYIQQNSNTNTTSRGHKSEILYLRSGYPDGSSPAQTLARVLSDVGSASRRHHRATSEALRVRRERSEASRLRVEQDGEYRAALEADRRREEERAAQLEVEAAAKTAAREAEAEAEREQEEAKAAQRAKRNDARVRLREEPGVGEGGTCRVRITMPCGARIDRRFYENDTVQSIRDFLTVSWEDAEKEADMIELLTTPTSRGRKKVPQRIENFSMSTNFPKRILDSNEMTLLGAGLVPQAVIMLQDLDA